MNKKKGKAAEPLSLCSIITHEYALNPLKLNISLSPSRTRSRSLMAVFGIGKTKFDATHIYSAHYRLTCICIPGITVCSISKGSVARRRGQNFKRQTAQCCGDRGEGDLCCLICFSQRCSYGKLKGCAGTGQA